MKAHKQDHRGEAKSNIAFAMTGRNYSLNKLPSPSHLSTYTSAMLPRGSKWAYNLTILHFSKVS